MNRFAVIFIIVCSVQTAFSQLTLSKRFLASKGTWELPVVNGILQPANSQYDPSGSVIIFTDSSNPVAAVIEGIVTLVDTYDSLSLIVVKCGNYFVGYSNLSSVKVKKGDQIKRGQSVGNAGKNLDDKYEVDLRISNSSGDLKVLPWFRKDVRQN